MAVSEDIRSIIRKFAIKNALDYGKADVGSVLGKSIQAAKGTPIPELKASVQEIINEVNALDKADLEKAYAPFEKEFEQRAKETAERTAKPRINVEGAVDGHVFTRFPPEPGGYIQIGNAKQCLLSEELANFYKGAIFLYFDDTNPEKCKQEYVDGIKRDTAWLGVKFSKEYYASDSIEKIYDAGRRLIRQNDAYACMCSGDIVKEKRADMSECQHRAQDPAENLKIFEEMLSGKYDAGQVIIRLKGDMKSENATFRDPTIFRIKKASHFRQGGKYIVWPTYHVNTPVIDNINGVTDVIRGKEYEIWGDINKKMLKSLDLKAPRFHYEARLRIKEVATAKREIRAFLKDGLVKTWDDPRLGTIAALRRRGIQAQAIRDFVLRFGLSLTDAMMSIDMLLAENKKHIDPIAKHLFFVGSPVKLSIGNANAMNAKLKLHPSNDYGYREYEVGSAFYISGSDAKSIKSGDTIRLKDLMDIKVSETGNEILGETGPATQKDKIIQWVPQNDCIECTVLVPGSIMDEHGKYNPDSLKAVQGYVEGYARKLNEHDIVQFERFGYCILDDKEKMQFIFISK